MLICLLFLLQLVTPAASLLAQRGFKYDTTLYNKMQWREIGPFRAGRSIAVAGHKDQPLTFYFGATGGGVWKSEDGGITWINVSDGFFKVGIVGALAVAESDPNVIYAGTGESCIRGNAMPGEGIYKSEDAAKTWKFIGLKDAQTISKIRVHPKDENIVYAAALGHVFGPNPERGVYRSKDGGKNWQKVLFKNDSTGAVDLAIDPNNPRILYAAMWQAYRNPWSMSSGGKGSGLWKSVDGGDTWTDLSANKGMPKGIKGKIGIAVSPAKPDRVWASIEADDGGLFVSDDAGKTWTSVNDDRRLRQRAWYYSHIFADPKSPETIYILNVQFHKSIDGGRSLTNISVPHGDNHDLWIDPNDPKRMITGDDGGASVSFNGGRTWTDEDIATAQFYHVTVDNDFPYGVYGAQQDNSTIKISSRTTGIGISRPDWFSVGGGESGYVTPDPDNPDVIYAGSYDGYLSRYTHKTDQEQDISPWPDNPMGGGASSAKYRFQWTYPILVSKFNSKVIYATANKVFKSTNEGMSWQIISPDLTHNDTSKLGSSGGPITKDNTSVEYYGTIFTFAESPVKKGVLWSGSDDGLIHVSRDDGATWTGATPSELPAWSMISIIDASPWDSGTAYVAANRYKLDDFRPYIFKTTNFGRSWTKIVRGIPDNQFAHVVREDPNRRGLLYAGTERGVYVSFDQGDNWQPLQTNLPVTPVHDLAIQAREKDLVAATHGRSFWILDDLTPLYQMDDEIARSDVHLFQPRETYRMGGFTFDRPGLAIGKNPPNGVVVPYYFRHKPGEKDSVKLEFLDAKGALIRSFTHREEGKGAGDSEGQGGAGADEGPSIPADSGMNRFVWDMRYPDAVKVPGGILWSGSLQGPAVIPGKYQVRLKRGGKSWTQPFEIRKDPRLATSTEEFQEQFDFLLKIRDKISEAHNAVNTIRDIRKQTEDLVKRLEKHPSKKVVADSAKRLNDRLKDVEDALIQVKIKSGQDALNYPIKLNDKLAGLSNVVGSADTRPTKQSYDVFNDLSAKVDEQLAKYKKAVESGLPAFDRVVKNLDIPVIIVKPAEPPAGTSQK
jgi:photosystem II stability/assembly factor-like uncharacterized protein